MSRRRGQERGGARVPGRPRPRLLIFRRPPLYARLLHAIECVRFECAEPAAQSEMGGTQDLPAPYDDLIADALAELVDDPARNARFQLALDGGENAALWIEFVEELTDALAIRAKAAGLWNADRRWVSLRAKVNAEMSSHRTGVSGQAAPA